jgi:3-phosphoshikimate 1-carboxyvinyltransferase
MQRSSDSRGPAAADGDWRAPAAARPVQARLHLPGSKSMTNRALVLAALADEPTLITGPLRARDTLLMAGALRALGAVIEDQDAVGAAGQDAARARQDRDAAHAGEDGNAWRVTPGGLGGSAPAVTPGGLGGSAPGTTVDVGNAGTVLRFVPPVAALARGDVEFRGDERAAHRPVGPLLAALRELGAQIEDGGRGALPFGVRGRGGITGGAVTLDASGSSQLVSGLLLSAPRYDKGAEVRHDGPRVPSLPHISMTVQMLRDAGADVDGSARDDSGGERFVLDNWRVRPSSLRPGTIRIEPDLSNAAPFLAAALVTGGAVTIADWPARSVQPGGEILDLLTRMGATCQATAEGMRVTGTGTIRGITADLRDVSEAVPVIAALAALANSPSALTGIGHMRRHESDRLAALAGEIGALGGDVTELADGLEIRPRPLSAEGTVFASHDDHRLVMAAAVLGLAVPGLRVSDAATVGKTFPAFGQAWSAMLEAPS